MSQLSKVAGVLRKNTQYPGVTAAFIAKKTGVPMDSIRKRVYDLRTIEGRTIYTNTRKVNGQKRTYYRFAV